ncbi:hypothetical protein J2S97_000696 [Arthrobacter oryzae]|jgi:hypothetical protein|nr:hypothetical protein [Arthrobacter oryzae]
MHAEETHHLADVRPGPLAAPGRPVAALALEDAIGRQATEIIDGVLAPDSGCDLYLRQRLRWHVATRPEHPELALLEHVLAIRGHERPARADNAREYVQSSHEERKRCTLP